MKAVVLGYDKEVLDCVSRTIPFLTQEITNYIADGVLINGQLVGGAVYQPCHRCVGLSVGGFGKWLTRDITLFILRRAFSMGDKIEVCTRKNDLHTRRLCQSVGFRKEGIIRGFYDSDDAVLYGMYRHECKVEGI